MQISKEKLNRFYQSPFTRNVFILQFSNIFIVFLSFIASVIFARILGPNDYGIYSLGFAFFGMLIIFLDYGSEQAILTLMAESHARKDYNEIKKIIIYFFKISLYKIISIGLIVFLLLPLISELFYQDQNIGYLVRFLLLAYLIKFPFVLALVIFQVTKKIKSLAIFEGLNKLLYLLIPVFLILTYGVKGIFWGNFIAAFCFSIISLGFYCFWVKKYEFLPKSGYVRKNFLKVKIRRYFKFGFLIAFDKNFANFYNLLPIFLLGMFVTTDQVAYYKIALSYVGIPIMILSPISRLLLVKFPEFKIDNPQKLKRNLIRISFIGLLLSLVGTIIFVVPAKFLVGFFYGQEFMPSLSLIYLLAIYAGLSGIGIGLGAIYRTMHKMTLAIKVNLILLSMEAATGYLLVQKLEAFGAGVLMIIFSLLSSLIFLLLMIRIINNSITQT